MKILIDGDGCPVKNIVFKIAQKYGIEVILVTSYNHYSRTNNKNTIYVDNVSQETDMVIIDKCTNGDLVITGDYGLASLCLMKGCYCLSFNGKFITNKNIDMLLNMNFIGRKVRAGGGRTKGPAKRNCNDDNRFEENLEKFILHFNSNPQLEL